MHPVEEKKNKKLLLFSCRTNWIKAVQMCSKAREFALALAILECAIKPVAMLPVWKDSLGHTRYTLVNINKAIIMTLCARAPPARNLHFTNVF